MVWSRSSWTTVTTNDSACSSERQCKRIGELTSHASEVMLQILQARLQQYVNRGLPDLQAGFRKGRGSQIANSQWIIEKARESQKNIYFCFIDYTNAFVSEQTVENSSRDRNTKPPYLPPEKSVCRSRSNS